MRSNPRLSPPSTANPETWAVGEPRSLRILVAEDNPINQKLMMQMLTRLGYIIDVADNGVEVLEKLHQQTYDVILMDVQMPEMDGLTATQRIRQEWGNNRHPTIIAVSARAMPEEQQACLTAGMDGYLAKPFRLEVLAAILKQCEATRPQASLTPAQLNQETLKEVQEMIGGDISFFVSLIDTYLEEAPKLLKSIMDAIAQQQADLLSWSAHSFRTMSAQLGATAFSQICSVLEEMGISGQIAPTPEFINQLEREYQQANLALRLERQRAQARLTH